MHIIINSIIRQKVILARIIIINSFIRQKVILARNRFRVEKIVQYHVGQAFFTKSIQDWKLSLCFARGGW